MGISKGKNIRDGLPAVEWFPYNLTREFEQSCNYAPESQSNHSNRRGVRRSREKELSRQLLWNVLRPRIDKQINVLIECLICVQCEPKLKVMSNKSSTFVKMRFNSYKSFIEKVHFLFTSRRGSFFWGEAQKYPLVFGSIAAGWRLAHSFHA